MIGIINLFSLKWSFKECTVAKEAFVECLGVGIEQIGKVLMRWFQFHQT